MEGKAKQKRDRIFRKESLVHHRGGRNKVLTSFDTIDMDNRDSRYRELFSVDNDVQFRVK